MNEYIDEIPPSIIRSRGASLNAYARETRKGRAPMPVCCVRCKREFRTQKDFTFHHCPKHPKPKTPLNSFFFKRNHGPRRRQRPNTQEGAAGVSRSHIWDRSELRVSARRASTRALHAS
jgi:hypothetical protein